MKLTPDATDDSAVISEAAARVLRSTRARESEDTKRKRALAELEAELVAPLAPGMPPHDLERIATLRPKKASEHDAPARPRVLP